MLGARGLRVPQAFCHLRCGHNHSCCRNVNEYHLTQCVYSNVDFSRCQTAAGKKVTSSDGPQLKAFGCIPLRDETELE